MSGPGHNKANSKDKRSHRIAVTESIHYTKARNKTEQQLLRHKLNDLEGQRRRSIRAIDEEERGLLRDLEAQRQCLRLGMSGSDITSPHLINNEVKVHKTDDEMMSCTTAVTGGHRFSLHQPIETLECSRRPSLPHPKPKRHAVLQTDPSITQPDAQRPIFAQLQEERHTLAQLRDNLLSLSQPENQDRSLSLDQTEERTSKQLMQRQRQVQERVANESITAQHGTDSRISSLASKHTDSTSILGPPLLNRRRNSSTRRNAALNDRQKENDTQRSVIKPSKQPNDDYSDKKVSLKNCGKELRLNFGEDLKVSSLKLKEQCYETGPKGNRCDISGLRDESNPIEPKGRLGDYNFKKHKTRIRSMSKSVNDVLLLSKSVDRFNGHNGITSTFASTFDKDIGLKHKYGCKMTHSQSNPPETTFDRDENVSHTNCPRNPRLSKGLSHFNKRITEVDICNGAGTSNRVQLAPLTIKRRSRVDIDVIGINGMKKSGSSPEANKSTLANTMASPTPDSIARPKLKPINPCPDGKMSIKTGSSTFVHMIKDNSFQGATSKSRYVDNEGLERVSNNSSWMRNSESNRISTESHDIMKDTHAQWEELGAFLDEVREHHNLQQVQVYRRGSLVGDTSQLDDRCQLSTVNAQAKAKLCRRHSENNLLLMTQVMRSFDCRKHGASVNTNANNISTKNNWKISDALADHPCHGPGQKIKNTAIKRLASMHAVLQSSALSMADIDSETF